MIKLKDILIENLTQQQIVDVAKEFMNSNSYNKSHDCKRSTFEFIKWLKKNKGFEPEALLLAPPKDIKKFPGKSGEGDSHIFAIVDGVGVDFTANQFPGISEPLKITPENQIPSEYKKIGGYYTLHPDWFENGKTSVQDKFSNLPQWFRDGFEQTGFKPELEEDLRDWFGKGKSGGVGGGGWDRYNSSGDRVGKCGDAKEGDAYSACLSKEKARKLGTDGRAAFVKRKRAAQSKGGDSKKGGERSKGQKPIKVKTGVKENISVESAYNKIDSLPQGKIFDDAKRIDNIFNKSKHSYSEVIEAYEKNKNNSTTQFVTVKDIHITQPNIQSNKVKQTITSSDVTAPLNVVQFPDGEMAIYDGHHRLTVAWAMGKNKIKVNLVKTGVKENLDPNTFKDTGKSSPYGSGYQKAHCQGKKKKGRMKNESTTKENLDPNNFLQQFQDKTGLTGSFKYIGSKNNEHIYTMPLDDLGSLNLIISEATIMARIGEDYAYFGIIYTLTGLERFDATVLLLKKTEKGTIEKQFDESDPDFSNSKTKFATLIKSMVNEQALTLFLEKNTPTNPEKWSYYKSQAKKKFDVYPSAYANAWAAKKYKAAGGGWRKTK